MSQTQSENEEYWEGEWLLADLQLIILVDKDNFVTRITDKDKTITLSKLPINKVDNEGNCYFGKLMHKRRGDEDLREKWKTNKP